MKKTFYFILICLLTNMKLSAQHNPDVLKNKISVTLQNKTIKQVFIEIQNLSNVTFGYSNNTFDENRLVTAKFNEATLLEILKNILPNNHFKSIGTKILILKKKGEKNIISGYIKEFGSQEVLSGVTVYMPELGIGTTTNNYGFYSLKAPSGKHKIIVSYLGYKTIEKSLNIYDNFIFTPLLKEHTEALETIVLNNTKMITDSKTVQMSVSKITTKNVNDLPAIGGEKDVMKTLQLTPGIQGGIEGSSSVFVRGGSSDQNSVIIDEAPLYNTGHLFGFFSLFNGDAIKSVDAYKGAFPARFGGRLSSVIDFKTKDGNKEKIHGKFDIGLLSSSLILEGPIVKNKTSFFLAARRSYLDLLLLRENKKSDSKFKYYFGDINFKIHHVFNKKNKLIWSNYLGTDDFNLIDNSEKEDKTIQDPTKIGLGIKWGNITSTLRWNHEITNQLFLNSSFIYSNFKITNSIDASTDLESLHLKYDSKLNDYTFKMDLDYYPNPNHKVKIGAKNTLHQFTPNALKYKDKNLDEVNNDIQLFQKIEAYESAIYIEDTWTLNNKLTIAPGLRYSFYKNKDSQKQHLNLEPRLAFSYNLEKDMALKLSYSKMNQFVHFLSNPGVSLETGLWVLSTDKIRPKSSDQVAFGVVKDFNDSGYSINIETYYKTSKNVINYKEGAGILLAQKIEESINWENNISIGNSKSSGVEVLLRKQKGTFTGWLGYTLSNVTLQFDDLNGGLKFKPPYNRKHNISVVVIYKPNQRWTFSANWVYTSGTHVTIPNQRSVNAENTFPVSSGNPYHLEDYNYVTHKGNFRGQPTHRLDIGLQVHKQLNKNVKRTWSYSLYNSYARSNPFYYSVKNKNDKTTITKQSFLKIIPSINLSYKF